MTLDFNAVFNDMVSAAESALKTNTKNVDANVREILEQHRSKLKQLTELHVAGELTRDELNSEIEDEMVIFNSELLVLKIAGKATIQNTVNAVSNTLLNAVLKRIA